MHLAPDMPTSSLSPLLRGLRILDLTRLLPSPFCTLYLTQLDAEVTAIEEPGSSNYARNLSPEMLGLINRGKQSLTLDLRKPDGVDAFKRLVVDADSHAMLSPAGLDEQQIEVLRQAGITR